MSVADDLEFNVSRSELFSALQLHADMRPDARALSELDPRLTSVDTSYKELAALARRYAATFAHEVPKGTTVLILMSKSAHCVAAMFGAMQSGHAFACLSEKLRPPQILQLIQSASPAYVLLDSAGLMSLRTMVPSSDVATATWCLIRDSRYAAVHERAREKIAQVVSLQEWQLIAESNSPASFDDPELEPAKRMACILFTSGSTGNQRGVKISSANLNACAEAEARLYGLTRKDSLLSVLPFAFDVGLMQLLSGIHAGASITFLNSWLPNDLLRACETRSITGISAVPSVWTEFLSCGRSFATDAEHKTLRYITISGGDLSPAQLANIDSIAPGVDVFKTYGQSETFRSAALKPGEFHERPTSVGRAFGSTQFYILRPNGSFAESEEVGEIVHTGLGTMLGYLGDNNSEKLRPNPCEKEKGHAPTAVFTGDLGWVDEQGYLYLQGRSDDLVKVNGNRVHLAEVRNELFKLDSVASAEVVSVPDEKNSRLVAFIVPRVDSELSAPQLRRALRKILPSYMVPDHIIFREQLPKTLNGKPQRQSLIADAQALFVDAPNHSSGVN